MYLPSEEGSWSEKYIDKTYSKFKIMFKCNLPGEEGSYEIVANFIFF